MVSRFVQERNSTVNRSLRIMTGRLISRRGLSSPAAALLERYHRDLIWLTREQIVELARLGSEGKLYWMNLSEPLGGS
jgi:hypothetical protein